MKDRILPRARSREPNNRRKTCSQAVRRWDHGEHHKLRRPQGSSIHGCNMRGVEGHQAAFCMNGSVDWANRWPRECFIIEPPQISLRRPDFRKMARGEGVREGEDAKKRNVRGEERRGKRFRIVRRNL